MKPLVLPPRDRAAAIAGVVRVLEAVHPGRPIRVKVEIARPDRTPQQNKYLWTVYKLLGEHLGMEAEELHEWNCGLQWGWKDRRCPKTPRNPHGVESVPIRTTTRDENGNLDNCTADEMVELWERAQRLGAQHGIVVHDPDPDYWKLPRSRTRCSATLRP